jgi:hypothetical protein
LLYQNECDIEEVENDEVYKDIYEHLEKMDINVLARKQKRLVDTMMVAFSISKSYLLISVAYIVTLYIFFTAGFNPFVAKGCAAVLTGAFLYKTYEFIINKFCYVDAHIVIIYKSVLEKLLGNDAQKTY